MAVTVVFSSPIYPKAPFEGYPAKNIVGTVQKVRPDLCRLYVIEENTQQVWDFFVHSSILEKFKEGERVRVYFESLKLPATSVQKMTPVKYHKQSQNQGYLHRSSEE